MSDTFGLLELPVPAPEDKDDPVGDPLLPIVGGFIQAVLNADAGDAWEAVCPGVPRPVSHVFTHDPDDEEFSAKRTPALYIWRGPDKGSHRYSQDLIYDDSGLQCLWVPPPATQRAGRIRATFRNAVKKALRAAFARGRHPAWIVPGDDYYTPETYGSVLLHHAKCAKLMLGEFRDQDLVLENFDGPGKTTFACLFFVIENLEFFTADPARTGGIPQIEGQGSFKLRDDPDDLLTVLEYRFRLSLNSLDVATGSSAGGETVTLSGKQFPETMDVLFGDALASDVTIVDESTCTVTTPAHDAGIVDVTIRSASSEAVLASAFTFT